MSDTMRWGAPITNLDNAKELLETLADPDHQTTEVGELGIDPQDIAAACTIVLQRLARLEERLEGKQLPFRPKLTPGMRSYQRVGALGREGKG